MIFGGSKSDNMTLQVLGATVGGSPVVVTNENFPGTNMQTEQPREIYRTPTTTPPFRWYVIIDQTTDSDFATDWYVNGIAFLYNNGHYQDWQIRSSLTDPNVTTSLLTDSGVIRSYNNFELRRYGRIHSFYEPPTAITGRYIRIDFTAGSAAIDYWSVGRLMLIDGYNGVGSFGHTISYHEDSEPLRTRAGLWSRQGRKYRSVQFSYPPKPVQDTYASGRGLASDPAGIGELDNFGHSKPMCVALQPDYDTSPTPQADLCTDWTFYGYVSDTANQYVMPDLSIRTVTLEEMERP